MEEEKKTVDLYVVAHSKENIGKKPMIVCIPETKKAKYEILNFDQLLEKILKKEDKRWNDEQRLHFRQIKDYKEGVDKYKKHNPSAAFLEFMCYGADQRQMGRIVDGKLSKEIMLHEEDPIKPYILRNLKIKSGQYAYDKLEMVVAYNLACC